MLSVFLIDAYHFISWIYHHLFNGSLTGGHLAFSQSFTLTKDTIVNKFAGSKNMCIYAGIATVKYSSSPIMLS